MNGSFYQNPTFQNETQNTRLEENLNNIFELNKGKKIKVYTSFPFSHDYKDKLFEGMLEGIKEDSLILSESDDTWYIIPLQFINYITFSEKVNI